MPYVRQTLAIHYRWLNVDVMRVADEEGDQAKWCRTRRISTATYRRVTLVVAEAWWATRQLLASTAMRLPSEWWRCRCIWPRCCLVSLVTRSSSTSLPGPLSHHSARSLLQENFALAFFARIVHPSLAHSPSKCFQFITRLFLRSFRYSSARL